MKVPGFIGFIGLVLIVFGLTRHFLSNEASKTAVLFPHSASAISIPGAASIEASGDFLLIHCRDGEVIIREIKDFSHYRLD